MDISEITTDNVGQYYLQEYNKFIGANDWDQFLPYSVSTVRKEATFHHEQRLTTARAYFQSSSDFLVVYLDFLEDIVDLSRFQHAMRLYYMGYPSPKCDSELARQDTEFKTQLSYIHTHEPDDIKREAIVKGMRNFGDFCEDYVEVIKSLSAHPEEQCRAARDLVDLAQIYDDNSEFLIADYDYPVTVTKDDIRVDNSDYISVIKEIIAILRQSK